MKARNRQGVFKFRASAMEPKRRRLASQKLEPSVLGRICYQKQ
jgi:hypothetical protein